MTRAVGPARLTTYTVNELRHMDLPPIRWAVDQIIGYGLWLIAAPPKSGKSYWVLDLFLAIATGGVAFGTIKVTPVTVLYLALEDNQRRLRSRLSHLALDESGWPDTFHLTHQAPKLDAGLIPALEAWLDQHPDCRIIAIDTLQKISGARQKNENLYASDSARMDAIQALAMRRDLCIIVVHHVRKAEGADVFETVSGSYGLTGPCDGVMILQRVRGEADATLHITGRDVPERTLALKFDERNGSCKLLGDAKLYAQSAERRTIMEAVTNTPWLTPKQIADTTGLKYDSVRHLCIRLRDEGKIRSDATGHYSIHSVHSDEGKAPRTVQTAVNAP